MGMAEVGLRVELGCIKAKPDEEDTKRGCDRAAAGPTRSQLSGSASRKIVLMNITRAASEKG